MVFFVRTSAFENDVAREAVLDRESEFGLVEDVLLRLFQVKKDITVSVLLASSVFVGIQIVGAR